MEKIYSNSVLDTNCNTVYKSCDVWIVVLEILPDTVTNESRSDISNERYAKYRANKLLVIDIVHKVDPSKKINSVQNTYYHEKVTYTIGGVTQVENFDYNLNTVCSAGIHFFRSYKAAFFYEFNSNSIENYTGNQYSWYNNGNKFCKKSYLNGKGTGQVLKWHSDSQIMCVTNLREGKEVGSYKMWHPNGQIQCEGNYVEGSREGQWTTFDENGNIKYMTSYSKGVIMRNEIWIQDECKFGNLVG
jgi:antitoxin component YwqK of YwqJK toxin-antitoxin module